MKIQRVDNPPEKARGNWELTLDERKYYFKTEEEAKIGIQFATLAGALITIDAHHVYLLTERTMYYVCSIHTDLQWMVSQETFQRLREFLLDLDLA